MAERDLVQGIYLLFNIQTGQSYIGSSNKVSYRWSQHKRDLEGGRHKNQRLQSNWGKYGDISFEFFIIEYIEDTNELLNRERYYIEKYQGPFLLNICLDPRRQRSGIKHTDEAKKRMSAAHKGRRLSEEHKAKIRAAMNSPEVSARLSAARTGRQQSAESNAKRSRAMKVIANDPLRLEMSRKNGLRNRGRIHSEEVRERMSEAHKGKRLIV